MIEVHPFRVFVPTRCKYLLLGSFVARPTAGYDWYYGNGRNYFWPILEGVYGVDLSTKNKRQRLFRSLGIAITDIIRSCERKIDNNSDTSLTNLTINKKPVIDICSKHKIERIFFTSKFVEVLFRKHFQDIIRNYPTLQLIALPSPSPRYALMSKQEKITKYREALPILSI